MSVVALAGQHDELFCFLNLEEHLSVNAIEHISTANEWVNQSSNGCLEVFHI
jgi:hypothetical protein